MTRLAFSVEVDVTREDGPRVDREELAAALTERLAEALEDDLEVATDESVALYAVAALTVLPVSLGHGGRSR